MEVAFPQSLAKQSGLGIFAFLLLSSLLRLSEANFFTAEPSNPTVAVLGVNSSEVVLHWNYSLPSGGVVKTMFITRYKDHPDNGKILVSKYLTMPAEIEPPFDNGRIELLGPATLLINNVTEGDQYVYRCTYKIRANNGAGTTVEKSSVLLKVYAEPKITTISTDQVTTQGHNVSLICEAAGRPTPTVSWTRDSDGDQVNPSFQILGKQDNGKYKCTASNGVGSPAIAYTRLDVQYLEKPKILPPSTNGTLRVRTNGTLFLKCPTEGKPEPRIKWLFNFVTLVSTKAVYMKEHVGSEDEGTYECVAENNAGLTTWNRVKVQVVTTSGEPEYAYNLTLRIIRKCWNDGYEDNTTHEYKNLSSAVKLELTLVYGGEASFIGIRVLNFSCIVSYHGDRAGSVLVDFQAIFDETIEENHALSVIREATKDGALGDFKVEADSPHILLPSERPTEKTTKAIAKSQATSKPIQASVATEVMAIEGDSGGMEQHFSMILLLGTFFIAAFFV